MKQQGETQISFALEAELKAEFLEICHGHGSSMRHVLIEYIKHVVETRDLRPTENLGQLLKRWEEVVNRMQG